jgi:hypothetical protein
VKTSFLAQIQALEETPAQVPIVLPPEQPAQPPGEELPVSPVEEEGTGSASVQAVPNEWVAVASYGEEFIAFPVEEVGTSPVVPDVPWTATPTGDEEFGGAHPTEESAAMQWTDVPIWSATTSTAGEDFAGSLPLEESTTWWPTDVPVWLSTPLVGEEIVTTPQQALEETSPVLWIQEQPFWLTSVSEELIVTMVDETPGLAWVLVEVPPAIAPPGEDFGGVHPTEEFSTWQWTPELPQWIVAPPSEDFGTSLYVDEYGVPAPVIPEPFWMLLLRPRSPLAR